MSGLWENYVQFEGVYSEIFIWPMWSKIKLATFLVSIVMVYLLLWLFS